MRGEATCRSTHSHTHTLPSFPCLPPSLPSPWLSLAAEKAIKLTINDVLRERFTEGNGDGKIKLWQEMASGAGAGFFQVAATNPMEIVKLRMQLQGESGVKKT